MTTEREDVKLNFKLVHLLYILAGAFLVIAYHAFTAGQYFQGTYVTQEQLNKTLESLVARGEERHQNMKDSWESFSNNNKSGMFTKLQEAQASNVQASERLDSKLDIQNVKLQQIADSVKDLSSQLKDLQSQVIKHKVSQN